MYTSPLLETEVIRKLDEKELCLNLKLEDLFINRACLLQLIYDCMSNYRYIYVGISLTSLDIAVRLPPPHHGPNSVPLSAVIE